MQRSNMGGTAVGDWVLFVDRQMQNVLAARNNRGVSRTMYRVPPPLRRSKPEDFTPGLMHFGLFDRVLDPRVDSWRVEIATAFLQDLEARKLDWNAICDRVVPDPEEMLELYDNDVQDPVQDPAVVRYLLTLDAILLTTYFTIGLVETGTFAHLESVLFQEGNLSHVINFLLVDIMLLENQIPLSTIRNVLKILYDVNQEDEDKVNTYLTTVCREAIIRYSRTGSIPGSGHLYNYAETVVQNFYVPDCKHLLDCLYRLMCHGVDHKATWTEEKGSYVSLPTVTQLQSAGIRFKGDTIGISDVRFEPRMFSATLYLPKLTLDTTTERIWRNLVAYESVNQFQYEFMCYLELMDELIDTLKDVSLLRKGRDPVISHNFLGSDKDVAAMFNSLLQKCNTKRSEKWIKLRKEIDGYYRRKYMKLIFEFREKYFSKPWLVVSVVAAFVLLLLTAVQTFYTVYAYYNSNSSNSSPPTG